MRAEERIVLEAKTVPPENQSQVFPMGKAVVVVTLASNGAASIVGAPNLLQRGLPGPLVWADCAGRTEPAPSACPEVIDVVCGPTEAPSDGGLSYNVAFHFVIAGHEIERVFAS